MINTATEIIYNGNSIASLEPGEEATLNCEGKKMSSNVRVKAAEAGGGAIDFSNIPTADSIDNPSNSDPVAVRFDGEIYLLVE